MKVSLVFVAWNRCFTSYVALRNIFENQKLDKYQYEFILVDDCSIDNTRETLNHFKNKYKDIFDIQIYHRSDDGGYIYTNNGVVKNFGIRKSSGEIIITFDIETYMLMRNGIENLVDHCISDHNVMYTPQWKMMESKSHKLFCGTVEYLLRTNIPSFDTTEMYSYFVSEAKNLLKIYDSLSIPCNGIFSTGIMSRGEEIGFLSKNRLITLINDLKLPHNHVLFETFQTGLVGLCHCAHRNLWNKVGGWHDGKDIWFEWGGAESYLLNKLNANGFSVQQIENNWMYHLNHPRLPDVKEAYLNLKCEIE